MSTLQYAAVAVAVGLNALDGYDVLAISFASPGIAADWHIERGALGVVLSMELLGMTVGSLLLGTLADRRGRRPTLLSCLVLMATGMFLASSARTVVALCAWRVLTGIGIGGALAALNAVVAEFSNARTVSRNISLMTMGYPVGAFLGGMLAARLLGSGSWRAVFQLGAFATAAFIPLVWFFVPESVVWLATKRPAGALERINAVLVRMRHTPIRALPARSPAIAAAPGSSEVIFAPAMLRTTLLSAALYFCHITTFYYFLKWVPKNVVDMGFAPAAAAGVLAWANVGGAVGAGVVGAISARLDMRLVTATMLVGSAAMVNVFARGSTDLAALSWLCACTGFFTNGAINGLYVTFAQLFPSQVRASGTGFAVGIGRGGSIVAPVLAGFLLQAGLGLQLVSLLLSLGSVLAIAFLWLLYSPGAAGKQTAAVPASIQTNTKV